MSSNIHAWVLALCLAAAPVLAHDDNGTPNDPGDDKPAIVVPNWRDNFVPVFDAGDPRTRHDSDPNNNESRDDAEVRKRQQRWRDEVRTDGSTGEVGEGCTEIDCRAVGDQNGNLVKQGESVSPGPQARGGEPNRASVEVLGAGATVDFGGSNKISPIFAPPSKLTDPEVETDTEAEGAEREAPNEIHFYNGSDHSLMSAAHSPNDHGDDEFNQHDTHGGTITADVFLPGSANGEVRDSNAGVLILDHLGCQFGCSDEYHVVYTDPGRLVFQVGEIPGGVEFVARDPDRWVFGNRPGQPRPAVLDATTDPVTNEAFGSDAWAAILKVNSSATGVGEASSLCCAPSPEQGGRFCNRNVADHLWNDASNHAGAGCVELATGDCIGGSVTSAGVQGCVVLGGQVIFGSGPQGSASDPAVAAQCTRRAAEACCANGGCL